MCAYSTSSMQMWDDPCLALLPWKCKMPARKKKKKRKKEKDFSLVNIVLSGVLKSQQFLRMVDTYISPSHLCLSPKKPTVMWSDVSGFTDIRHVNLNGSAMLRVRSGNNQRHRHGWEGQGSLQIENGVEIWIRISDITRKHRHCGADIFNMRESTYLLLQ